MPTDEIAAAAAAMPSSSLLDVEQDLFFMILKEVDIFSQFQLSETHPYLERVVKNEWRFYKHNLTVTEDMTWSCTGSMFRRCFAKLAPFVRHLTVDPMSVTMYRDLIVQIFPNVRTYDLTSKELPQSRGIPSRFKNDSQFGDLDMENVLRMFPRLKELKLSTCSISGEHIGKLHTLEYVRLRRCSDLVSEKVKDILRLPNLKKFDIMYECDNIKVTSLQDVQLPPKMEHFKISDEHLWNDMTAGIAWILRTPSLKKLSVLTYNEMYNVLDEVSSQNASNIVGFKYYGKLYVYVPRSSYQLFFSLLSRMTKLKKFVFYEGHYKRHREVITDAMMLSLSKSFTDLEELRFVECNVESDLGILSFVENCPHLKLIDLTKSQEITEEFVWLCIKLLKERPKPPQPLELWVSQTAINGHAVMMDARDKAYVKIVTKDSGLSFDPPGVLKFTFK